MHVSTKKDVTGKNVTLHICVRACMHVYVCGQASNTTPLPLYIVC